MKTIFQMSHPSKLNQRYPTWSNTSCKEYKPSGNTTDIVCVPFLNEKEALSYSEADTFAVVYHIEAVFNTKSIFLQCGNLIGVVNEP